MFENYVVKDWHEYYNTFEKNFINFDNFRKKINELEKIGAAKAYIDVFCQNYCVLFNQAVETLGYFLEEKGLFQTETKEILAEAYYVGLIEDGQCWVDVFTLVDKYESGQITEELVKLIAIYATGQKFNIFEILNNNLKKMAG